MIYNIKIIEQPFIIEIIDERFDNISIMLTDNAVVYGGSVTSIMSGLSSYGDLDIAVSNTEFMTLCKRFANSSKWKQTDGDIISETDFSKNNAKYRQFSSTSGRFKNFRGCSISGSKRKPFKKSSYRNISKTVTFETVGNKRVQIIEAKETTNDPLSDALSVVRAVDFIFCGIAVDKHGKTFEVIESAFDDCSNKIIRVANYHSRLTERFHKYIKRGWDLGISIDQANQNYLNLKKKEVKATNPEKYIKIERDRKTGNIKLRFVSPMFKKLSRGELHGITISTARRAFGVHLKEIDIGPENSPTFVRNTDVESHAFNYDTAKAICNAIIYTVKNKSVIKKKKKFLMPEDYSSYKNIGKTGRDIALSTESKNTFTIGGILKDDAEDDEEEEVATETKSKPHRWYGDEAQPRRF